MSRRRHFPPSLPSLKRRLRKALLLLAREDEDLGEWLARLGTPPPRLSEAGFPTILRAITGQQLSNAAAAAICQRLEAAGASSPQTYLTLSEQKLREIGLSRRKVGYARELASAFCSRALNIEQLEGMGDEAAVAALCAYPGVGRWTAEIYMLFAHARLDMFPAGDLALQKALERLVKRPFDERSARLYAERWRPYRGAAAHLLWRLYRAER